MTRFWKLSSRSRRSPRRYRRNGARPARCKLWGPAFAPAIDGGPRLILASMHAGMCQSLGYLTDGCGHSNLDSSAAEHRNQSIDTEQVNLATHEIADSRLSHSHQFGSLCLSPTLFLDQLAQEDHQIRPDSEVLRFLRGKPQFMKDVGAQGGALSCHLAPLSLSAIAEDQSQALSTCIQI